MQNGQNTDKKYGQSSVISNVPVASALESGATRRDRTGDLLITNQPLYQLS